MNKREAKYIIVPFITIILGFLLLNIIVPNRNYSVTENRNLEKRPILRDNTYGEFISKFESYYNDNFIFKDQLIGINNKAEFILDKTKVGNYYVQDNNWILGTFHSLLNNQQLLDYSNKINKLSKISVASDKEVYFTMMPHKKNMLKHLFDDYIDTRNVDLNINNFSKRLDSKNIKYIGMDKYFLNQFTDKEREDLYFKTDHHWKGLGAFEGFKMMISNMNLEISQKDLDSHFNKYKTATVKDKKFIGSYNRNLNMLVKENEYPNYAYINSGNYRYNLNGVTKQKEEIIATSTDDKEWDYGGAYMSGENTSILNIKNDKALIDKKILIFKDSYQVPTTWLFADIFKEVEIADPRSLGNIEKTYEHIIKDSDSDIVMFMYNSSGFNTMIKSMIDYDVKIKTK